MQALRVGAGDNLRRAGLGSAVARPGGRLGRVAAVRAELPQHSRLRPASRGRFHLSMPWPSRTTVITCPGSIRTVVPSSDVVTVTWPEWPAVIRRWREGAVGAGVSLPGRGARDNVAVLAVLGRSGCADPGRPAAPPAIGRATPHAATARTTAPTMTAPAAEVEAMWRCLADMSTWTHPPRARFRGPPMGRAGARRGPAGHPARCPRLSVRLYQCLIWPEAALVIGIAEVSALEPRRPCWPSWCPHRPQRRSACGCTRLP